MSPNVQSSADKSRRAFLKKAGKIALGVGCGACLMPITGCLLDPESDEGAPTPFNPGSFHNVEVELDLSEPRFAVLSQAGGALRTVVTVENSESTIIIARQMDETLRAFSACCTHAGCTVNAPAGEHIECPCHGSRFSMNGEVLRGPAASPLSLIPMMLRGNTVVLQFRRLTLS